MLRGGSLCCFVIGVRAKGLLGLEILKECFKNEWTILARGS